MAGSDLASMPLEYCLIAKTKDGWRVQLFDRRLHASRTPDLNTAHRVLSRGLEIRNGVWPATITQRVTPSEYRSERMSTPTPANCSGLANSGVPANVPGNEIPAPEADSSSVFARPRSIIFVATLPSSFTLTMILVGLISRWTSFCS